MPRALGANAQLLVSFATSYGGVPGAAAAWFRMPFSDVEIGDAQPLEASDLLGMGRDPAAPSRGVITNAGSATVPLDERNIGIWLKSAFGAPTTAGGVHTFASGAKTLPDLCAEIGFTDVGIYQKSVGLIVESVKLAWSSTAGKSSVAVALIGQGQEADAVASVASAPSELALTRFSNFQGEIKQGSTVLGNVMSAEFTYANGLDPARVIRRDGKIAGVDPGVSSGIGKLTCRFDEQALLDEATAGDPISLSMGFEAESGHYLRIALPAVYLPRPKISVKGPGGIEVPFDFQAARPGGGTPFVTVSLKNDVASY